MSTDEDTPYKKRQREFRELNKAKTSFKEYREKEDQEMFDEIRKAPGWTGDHGKDSLNPAIQNIIKRRHLRQKV